jgi:hypothetical protein
MRSRFLPVILSNADFRASHLLLAAAQPGPFSLRSVHGLCESFRIRGCATFFWSCRPDALHLDLQRSGTAYAHFLNSAADNDRITGRAAPFFDAIACGDRASAERIAGGSARYAKPERELVDDFLYVHLLMERFFRAASDAEIAPILAAFAQALENKPTPRFEICRALLARDAGTFHDALTAMIDEHRRWYVEGFQKGKIPEETLVIEGCLFVEGLALVRLAREVGIKTEPDYPLIPGPALTDQKPSPDPNAWRSP